MATKASTAEYILDQLSGLPHVRAKKMFGDYALYCADAVVGLICDNELFLKYTDPGRKLLGDLIAEGQPFPGAKNFMHVSGDVLEDRLLLSQLVGITEQSLPRKPVRRKK